MHLNQQKWTFSVSMGKNLRYLVSQRGMPSKTKAITEMSPSKKERERERKKIWPFLGQLQTINQFICETRIACQSIVMELRRSKQIDWDKPCQKAFEAIIKKKLCEY